MNFRRLSFCRSIAAANSTRLCTILALSGWDIPRPCRYRLIGRVESYTLYIRGCGIQFSTSLVNKIKVCGVCVRASNRSLVSFRVRTDAGGFALSNRLYGLFCLLLVVLLFIYAFQIIRSYCLSRWLINLAVRIPGHNTVKREIWFKMF